MHNEIILYKAKFLAILYPFIEMLENLMPRMKPQDWINMVRRIESGVRMNPEQYLGRDLPAPMIADIIVKEIFEDFVQSKMVSEQSLAAE